MAHLGQKSANGIFLARFRYAGREYQKSLKTRNQEQAEGAMCLIRATLYKLHTGQLTIPDGIDPGGFIVSGGVLPAAVPCAVPVLENLISIYLSAQFTKAESSVDTERTHLNNLKRTLGAKALWPSDQITHAHLTECLRQRQLVRCSETVKKERVTIVQLFTWACAQGHLPSNPAANLPKVKGSGHRSPFRTVAEIEALVQRGGLTAQQLASLLECLYLSPQEIASVLALVRKNGKQDFAFLLHLIPAFTGMRRGETMRLRWSDVDFEHETLTARSKKQSRQVTETARQIDMHPELKRELMAWREQRPRGQFVICPKNSTQPLNPDDANKHFWQPLRDTTWQIKMKGKWNYFKIGFHTYRHSFASNLAAAGVDQRIIDLWMGHQTEAMRKRYQHLYPNNRRDAIGRLSFQVS